MDALQATERVEAELERGHTFDNWHGITEGNVRERLVTPLPVQVSAPQEGENASMWLVLEEHEGGEAYVVLLDVQGLGWALAYREPNGTYTLIERTDTFAAALTMM